MQAVEGHHFLIMKRKKESIFKVGYVIGLLIISVVAIAPVLNFPKIILIFLTYKSQNSTINIWKTGAEYVKRSL